MIKEKICNCGNEGEWVYGIKYCLKCKAIISNPNKFGEKPKKDKGFIIKR